eukprot:EG_transcript_23031
MPPLGRPPLPGGPGALRLALRQFRQVGHRVHPLAFDFGLDVYLRGYERPRVERAAHDVAKFVQDVVPPALEQRRRWVERCYLAPPVHCITVPQEVVDEPNIQAYARQEAETLQRLLDHAIREAQQCAPVKCKTAAMVWTVLSSPFKYKRHFQKLDEVIYTAKVSFNMPMRDEALEERFAAIPGWLPIGVEAQVVTRRVENFTCPLTLEGQKDSTGGLSLLEKYCGP